MLVFCRRELCVPLDLREQVHAVQIGGGAPLHSLDLGAELRALRDHGPLTEEETESLSAEGLAEYMTVVITAQSVAPTSSP
jgi:hypothetical protein